MLSDLHKIKPPKGSRKKNKRVGRGNASQKGTTAARGMKGQTARSGGQRGGARLALRRTILKAPKLRGFKSLVPKKEIVTLSKLDKICKDGDVVTPTYLKKKGVIGTVANGVKILSTGALTKKITLKGCLASKSAMEAIEKVGGSLEF